MKPISRSFAATMMIAASLMILAPLLTACGSSNTMTNRLVPQAQAEADLQRALQAGAITQSEYEEELEKLRKGN
jgi:hypothetical protein